MECESSMIRFVSSFIVISLFSPAITIAQVADTVNLYDLTLEELGNLSVYSTTRTVAEEADDAPAHITVITSTHIAERGYKSLMDVFEDLPNFKVDRGVDPRWLNDVTVRGVRYMDKLIILLDGVRISSPTNEIVSIFENYPVHLAEQIEVVYGPSSSLYGADAFVGVVNIVTKKPESGDFVQGSVHGGMYGSFYTDLFWTKSFADDWDITIGESLFIDRQPDLSKFYPTEFVGMEEQLQTGIFNTILGPIQPSTPVDPEKGFPLEAVSLFGRLGYKDFSFTFFGNHAHNPSTVANSPSNAVYNEGQLFGHDVKMYTGRYLMERGDLVSSSQLTFSTYRLDGKSNFRNVFTAMEPAYKYARSWKFKAEQLVTFPLAERLKITTGATFERFFSIPRSNDLANQVIRDRYEDAIIVNSIAPNNPSGIPAALITTSYNNVGGLVQVDWSAVNWNVIAGARLDKDERYKRTINPRVGIVYNPSSRFTGKLLYGTAFLAPSPQNMFDRFGTFDTDDGGLTYNAGFFQLPNPNLQPQTISTTEINLKYFLLDNLCFDVSGYYSNIDQLISPITNLTNPERVNSLYPGGNYTLGGEIYPIDIIQINDNLGESSIYGGSITVNYLWRPQSNWSGDFFIISSLVEGSIDIDEVGPSMQRNLPGVSPSILRIGATLKNGPLSINTRLALISNQRTIGVNTVKDQNNDGISLNDTEYQELDGYHMLNININYQLKNNITFSLSGRNITDQRFRNVNIGANPEAALGGGSSEVEFANGAPQNPVRLTGGVTFRF